MIKRATPLLLAAASAGCAGPPAADAPPPRTVLVTRATASSGPVSVVIGTARATATHMVATEPGGRVVRLLVDVGDVVRAGQVLALLDAKPAQLRHVAAEARLRRLSAQAEERARNAERVQSLVAAGSGAAADLDAARGEARASSAAVAEARAEALLAARTARLMAVRAPVAGTITARPASLSMEAAPGAALFELQAMRGMTEIVAPVAEDGVGQLKLGAMARFAGSGGAGQAVLSGISARGTALGLRETRWRVTGGSITPGTTAELSLPVADTQALLVPAGALITRASGARVVRWVDAQSRVREAPVTLQAITAEGALVRGAVPPAARIIAAGAGFVSLGAAVRPRPLD